MKKFVQNKLKNQKGMTLIELLAVIVIIAIIAAIAIPAIGNIIDNSRYGAAKSDVLNAFAAADLYIADEAKDPASVAALVPAYMEATDTVSAATFSRATTAGSPLKIAGTVTVNKVAKTLPAKTKAEIVALSSKEFKALLNGSTTP